MIKSSCIGIQSSIVRHFSILKKEKEKNNQIRHIKQLMLYQNCFILGSNNHLHRNKETRSWKNSRVWENYWTVGERFHNQFLSFLFLNHYFCAPRSAPWLFLSQHLGLSISWVRKISNLMGCQWCNFFIHPNCSYINKNYTTIPSTL